MKFKKELEVLTTLGCSVIKPNEEIDMNCLFQVRTFPPDEGVERKPIELACVLDISGSMQGPKLKWSKRAIRKIVKHLKPTDIVHFITYDSKVDVVFERGDLENKEKLINAIKNVRSKGCTNISAGLEKTFAILKKNKNPEISKRIFMFSDGHANEGIRTNDGLFKLIRKYLKAGVVTSTFGIGNNFNEILISGMATEGSGRYFFLDEKSITKQVSKAIHGLIGQVGTKAELAIKGIGGSRVEKIFGRDHLEKFSIGDLFADNNKNILVQFHLPPLPPTTTTSDEKEEEEQEGEEEEEEESGFVFCEYELRYESSAQGEIVMKGVVKVKVEQKDDYSNYESFLVKISLMVKKAADQNEYIAKLLSENNLSEAKKATQELIDELEGAVENDETGKIKMLIEKGKEDLENMKRRGNVKELQKRVAYRQYQCAEDSSDGFESGNDSDSWDSEDDGGGGGGGGAGSYDSDSDDDDDDSDDDVLSSGEESD